MAERTDIYENWNPWHGCTKVSPGCKYCYVYRQDDMYGSESEYISRHALHSHVLEFPHPKSKELIFITAPLPEDMLKLLGSLFSENAISSLKEREPALFGISK